MPRASVDLLLSYYLLEPWGDDWRQTSTIATEIYNSAGYVDSRTGDPVKLDSEFFVPVRPPGKPRKVFRSNIRPVSDEEAVNQSAKLAGF